MKNIEGKAVKEQRGGTVIKTAEISSCGKYRYELTRTWDPQKMMVCFIGLNPSTADAENDDATIRKCIGFAQRWEYGGILMLNIFAFRTVSPAVLKSAMKRGEDVVSIKHNRMQDLRERMERHFTLLAPIACWGQHAGIRGVYIRANWNGSKREDYR